MFWQGKYQLQSKTRSHTSLFNTKLEENEVTTKEFQEERIVNQTLIPPSYHSHVNVRQNQSKLFNISENMALIKDILKRNTEKYLPVNKI